MDVGRFAAPPQEFNSEFDGVRAEASEPIGLYPVLVRGDRSSLAPARWPMGKIHPQENWATEYLKLVPTLFDRTKFTANSPPNQDAQDDPIS
jgi:hypothetical protein